MARPRVLSLLLFGTLALAACGGQQPAQANKGAGGAPGSEGQVTVRSQDAMRFEPANVTARVNTPVRLTLDNSSSALAHDWVVDDVGGGRKVQIRAEPRQRQTDEFTATAAGSYQIYCAEPGHKEAGMVGTLTVN
jgi:uncharacterized cupredoxin-like copper-binding protein